MAKLFDSLRNLISNIGTGRDKFSATEIVDSFIADHQLVTYYENSWLVAKGVNIPANDSVMKWRHWNGDKDQIEKIKALEIKLRIKSKIREALIKARVFGGAAIYINDGGLPENEYVPGVNPIRSLAVLNKRLLTATGINKDLLSDNFDRPDFYQISLNGRASVVHQSRLIKFNSNIILDTDLNTESPGWSKSIIKQCIEDILRASLSSANVMSLMNEANVDIISIPELSEKLIDEEQESLIKKRFELAKYLKSINNLLLMDSEETFNQKTISLNGLDKISENFYKIVAASFDIPYTRYMSQSPAGMNATGDSDLKNYYSSLEANREMVIGPEMQLFDEGLIIDAIGFRDEGIGYKWASLSSPSSKEIAEIADKLTSAIDKLAGSEVIPSEILSEPAIIMLEEHGLFPGLGDNYKNMFVNQNSDINEV